MRGEGVTSVQDVGPDIGLAPMTVASGVVASRAIASAVASGFNRNTDSNQKKDCGEDALHG